MKKGLRQTIAEEKVKPSGIDPGTCAYVGGTILDGTKDMKPVTGMAVLTKHGKITGIVPDDSDLSKYNIVNLGGMYLMPGLINMHVHIVDPGKPPKKKQRDNRKFAKLMTGSSVMRTLAYKLCVNYALQQLYSGTTTIRTMGGVLDIDSRIRDEIRSGKIPYGPRILASNMAVSVPGGHMAGSLAHEATSAKNAAQCVEDICATKPDLIKLMITGGALDGTRKGEAGELKMPADYVKACCEAAHRHGLKVAAHVEGAEGLRIALQCGVDTIEHGAIPDEEIIKLFKEKGAALICTISPAIPFTMLPPEKSNTNEVQQYNGQLILRGIIECANECLENEIPVGLGTDSGCPYTTQYDMWRELYYFQKYCNVSNAFALYSATGGNAKIAGIDHITGTIEVGKAADMIATMENPLESLTALRNVSMVVSGGRRVPNLKLRKLPEVDRELDTCL